MDLVSKLKGSGGDSAGEQKPDRDPKDAAQQPPPTPDSSKTKISLDRATREELVEFVKKQNVHTKKLETKYTELATQFRTQTASLKAAERQLAVRSAAIYASNLIAGPEDNDIRSPGAHAPSRGGGEYVHSFSTHSSASS